MPPVIFWRHIQIWDTTKEPCWSCFFFVFFHNEIFVQSRKTCQSSQPDIILMQTRKHEISNEGHQLFWRKKTCICCIYNEQPFSSFSARNTLRFSYGGCRLIETWEQNKNRLPKQHWGISLEKIDLNNIKYLASNYYFWHPLIEITD